MGIINDYFEIKNLLYISFNLRTDLPLVDFTDYFWKLDDDHGVYYADSKESILEDDNDWTVMDHNTLYFIDGCMIGVSETDGIGQLLVFDKSKEVK